jgi:hypothetical protein
MDPYLEHSAVFPGLHSRLIAALSESLQAMLPAPYYAEIGERVWVEVSQRFIEPDATVLRREDGQEPGAVAGLVATAGTRSRSVLVTVPHDERREPFVEILAPGPGEGSERLVTAIELLSPSNKTPGERGRELYLRKQRELLEGTAHLVEIDLLRGGVHSTAVPLEQLSVQVGPFDYHVSVHRSDRFEEFRIYPIRLDEPLPEVVIPLLQGDPDVPIDLQAVFDRVYDAGPYRRRIRYAESLPVPSLRADQSEWAARIVAHRGA